MFQTQDFVCSIHAPADNMLVRMREDSPAHLALCLFCHSGLPRAAGAFPVFCSTATVPYPCARLRARVRVEIVGKSQSRA